MEDDPNFLLDELTVKDRVKKFNQSSIECTFLTKSLRNLVKGIVSVKDKQFSWANPEHYNLKLWDKKESPVPEAVLQQKDMCIPYQVYYFIKFHMNLIAKLSGEPVAAVPEISLAYLLSIFRKLKPENRTFEAMLLELHNKGFLAEKDFDERKGTTKQGAKRFYMHWSLEMELEDYESTEKFEEELKKCILYHGGVLAEIEMTKEFNPYGTTCKGVGTKREEQITTSKNDVIEMPLGHALTIISWKETPKGLKFMYLNCHGKDWGLPPYTKALRKGFGWIKSKDLFRVYVPQVLKPAESFKANP
ncbi:hypothetical protein POM88_038405 [Heracleum sosnowskyi]|uniref:Uncharacterized protein n=1 Tax=Heracleum sosnowskyi TaxID=360622 RepID=A0AAD8H979_9APIA|nr:hypothetical protein POM88_038403 [Heracleum sosnowskyi]KAK1362844.1 hypothetical protein POM88_038405 [Heracleum sosnowskyi]